VTFYESDLNDPNYSNTIKNKYVLSFLKNCAEILIDSDMIMNHIKQHVIDFIRPDYKL